MDLVVFENNKALVLDEFRAGRFDYVELASDVAETKFFQFLFGAGIVVTMVVLAIFASVVTPYDPTEMKMADALKAPSRAHPFGTDRFGRDVLSRTIHGSRIALGVALSSIGIALVVGTALGLLGGYRGGATDLVIGRAMDVLFSFPR